MDDYRELQRQKWQEKQEEQQRLANATSSSSNPVSQSGSTTASPEVVPSNSTAVVSSGDVTSALVRRVHILPVGGSGVAATDGQRRLEQLAPELRRKRLEKDVIKRGNIIRSSDVEFVVVKSEPEEGILGPETDYFFEGDAVPKFEKVQFICLWDFESENSGQGQDASSLFSDYISPHFKNLNGQSQDAASVIIVGETLKIRDKEFQVMAAQPSPPEIGIMATETMVYVDYDATPEFERIHIVPFQDTLPGAYEFDVFNDYLKPYLTRNKHMRFAVNDQFVFQGVQFKVVCCEPAGPARIGRNSTIYCEGVLHPSLRNLLPPELLEQLSHLPPGLQMLLLNTDALVGGYEERLMEVQGMLGRRRGLTPEEIASVETYRWGESGRDEPQLQCMVCLSDFVQGEELRRLPCQHCFHTQCIDEWLSRCTECPICKGNVATGAARGS